MSTYSEQQSVDAQCTRQADRVTGSRTLGPVSPSEQPEQVPMSSTFYAGNPRAPAGAVEDLVFVSSDHVLFCLHSEVVLAASSNSFGNLVDAFQLAAAHARGDHVVVAVPETASVLNVILHAIYGLSCKRFDPPNADLFAAVGAFQRYGISAQTHTAPSTALFQALLARVHTAPLEFYVLAAQHDLYPLAAHTSTHLLGCKATDIPLDVAERIGPVYLARLFALQETRQEALKALLRAPPAAHAPTPACSAAALGRAWELASAYLIWEMRPQLTTITLDVTFGQLGAQIKCPLCEAAFDARLAEVLAAWAANPLTI